MKSTESRNTSSLMSTICYWYLFITITIYPFFISNGYFNTIYAKGRFQLYLILFTDIACLIGLVIQKIRKTTSVKTPSLTDKFVFGFGGIALISAAVSAYGSNAFSGTASWYMAAIELVFFCSIYFLVKNHLRNEPTLFYLSILIATLIFFIGVLQGFSLDIFHLKNGLIEDQMADYISTVGNTNIFAGFLTMALPFLFYHGIQTESDKKWLTIAVKISIVLGFDALLFAGSDAGYLGVGVGLLILLGWYLHTGDEKEHVISFLFNGLYIGVSYFIIDIFYLLIPGQMIPLKGVSKVLLSYHLEIPLIFMLLILVFICKKKRDFHTKYLFKTYVTLIAVGCVIAVLYNAFHFSFEWGTKRGYIWYMALDLWVNGSVKDKLLGFGPDCFGLAVDASFKYSDYILRHWKVPIGNAHNEILQYLTTMGIAGCLCYIGIFAASIYEFVKKDNTDKYAALPFFAAVIGYFAQALVTNPNPFTATFFVICLGCLNKTNKYK